MNSILKAIEKDATLTPEALARMYHKEVGELRALIEKWEKEGVILGKRTLIDWDKAGEECVRALIEVKIDHRGAYAYDKFAQKIRNYPEVKSVYLMSGGFDFSVVVEGRTLKEVAFFVGEKLSSQEMVLSTGTHFILKKYKENDIFFMTDEPDERVSDLI